jgi:hypothetical protein
MFVRSTVVTRTLVVRLVFVSTIVLGAGATPPQLTGPKSMVLLLGQPESVPAVPCPVNVRDERLEPQVPLVIVIVDVAATAVVLVGRNVAVPEERTACGARVTVPPAGKPANVTAGFEGAPMVKVAAALPVFSIESVAGADGVPTSLDAKP